jgi:hypothetical protein
MGSVKMSPHFEHWEKFGHNILVLKKSENFTVGFFFKLRIVQGGSNMTGTICV